MPEQQPLTRCPYAYFLLEYIADDGTSELVWNSLDAEPPLTLPSPHNLTSHLFGGDYRPGHVPKVGDRIFVELTDIRARALAIERLDWEIAQEHAEQPKAGESLEERYPTRDEALEALELFVRDNRRGLDVLVVTHGYLERLAFVRSGPQAQARLHNLERDDQTLPDRGTRRYAPSVIRAIDSPPDATLERLAFANPEVQITGFGVGERPTSRDASARAAELQSRPHPAVRELGVMLRTRQPPRARRVFDVDEVEFWIDGVQTKSGPSIHLEVTPIPMINGRPMYRDRHGEPISDTDYALLHRRSPEYTAVARMEIGSVVVATSWLGSDYASEGPPQIFETMVLERADYLEGRRRTPAKRYSGMTNRYATEADAELGHAEVCAIVALQEAADGRLD